MSNFKRIDGPYSWVMCTLLFVSVLLQYGCAFTYGISFPSISNEFKSGRAVTAIPGSLAIATNGLFGTIIGRLCDHFGSRKMMIFGCLISAGGLIASAFVTSIYQLIVTYGLLLGVGNTSVFFCGVLGVQLYFEKYKFEAISLVHAGPAASLLVMSPIVEQTNKVFGWRKSMLCLAGFSIVPFLAGLLLRSKLTVSTDSGQNDSRCKFCKISNVFYWSAFKIKTFSLTAFMIAVTFLGHSMPFVHLAKFSDDNRISSDLSSWLYFTIGLSSTISRVLVAKFGKSVPLSLPQLFQLGCVIVAVGNFCLPSSSKFYILLLISAGYGLGDGLLLTPCVNIVMDCLPPKRRGSGFGLYQLCLNLSYMIGPPFSGFIADISGSYKYSFYVAAVLEFIGGSFAFLFRFIPSVEYREEAPLEAELFVTEKETVL